MPPSASAIWSSNDSSGSGAQWVVVGCDVGILGPTGRRPSWGFLALLGLIGGGPTFAGTLIGQRFVNDTVSIGFLGLAAGSILYVVIELLAVARKTNLKTITTWGIFAGLILGFATDAVITAAGA